jgi:hypothetical protein
MQQQQQHQTGNNSTTMEFDTLRTVMAQEAAAIRDQVDRQNQEMQAMRQVLDAGTVHVATVFFLAATKSNLLVSSRDRSSMLQHYFASRLLDLD